MCLTRLGMFFKLSSWVTKDMATMLRIDYNVITAPLIFKEHLTNLSGVMNHRWKGKECSQFISLSQGVWHLVTTGNNFYKQSPDRPESAVCHLRQKEMSQWTGTCRKESEREKKNQQLFQKRILTGIPVMG